ncbi:MAG: type II secretion system major pseudopilin GspG [Magnetococcales bacterium]|nr:type II secretion system major pseudopilin GspG [Magnetococcales bacterium]
MKDFPKQHRQSGFTLIELLIVMVIIGLLASLVAPDMFAKVDSAKIKTATAQMQLLKTAIDTFRLDVGDPPANLEELLKSDRRGWNGPYMPKAIPPDPWGNPYLYKFPGERGAYDLTSLGKDGKVGGDGDNADIDL